ncbi:MAG: VWA domain-containing protein [Gemmataceae bacterium]|nr:VWA domain-containing protein [Gemmataceae bacterium]
MAQLKSVVDPFGEVNVRIAPGGKVKVTATILMLPHKEGCQTGVALDGSGSMAPLYGVGAGTISPLFATQKPVNQVSPVAQKICAYLARKVDADGGTTCIYWATGPSGSQYEVLGDFTGDEVERFTFNAPTNFGTGTQLLPAVQYFTERFKDAPFGFYVFITDGEIHDLEEVKAYTVKLSKQISQKKRNPLKFVLIGVGPSVNEKQMEELDDLDTEVDLWDHKLAAEMRQLEQIFSEVVDNNARVAPTGRIVDQTGKVLKDYSDTGVPAYLEFFANPNSQYFTLEIPGLKVSQPLMEGIAVPAPVRTAETPSQASQSGGSQKNTDSERIENLKIDSLEPTLPGLDFKLEFEKNNPNIDLDKNN